MSKHIGFKKLSEKVARNERKAHPSWSWQKDKKVGRETAGKIAKQKRRKRR